MNKEKTIFEMIIDRELPSWIIYEDDSVISFLNIAPFEKGHTLVVPKKVYENIWEMPEDEYHHIQSVIYKVVKKHREVFGEDITVFQRSGKKAGQEIPHLHYHIVSRFSTEQDRQLYNDDKDKVDYVSDEEKQKYADMLKCSE